MLDYSVCLCILQVDPNQNPLFQMAVPLKLCISDLMLVKPKCVWEVVVFLKNCKQMTENFFENWKKSTASQMHFDFTSIRLEMHSFRGTAICNNGFWFGSPCKRKFLKEKATLWCIRSKKLITLELLKTTRLTLFSKKSQPTKVLQFIWAKI